MVERFVRVAGLRTRIVEALPERERDDAVLLIHGLGGWAENWRAVMPAIAASGRRAIAFDLPGYGLSERPREARFFDPDRPFYAAFALAVLDALGIERAHVAGHSLGGAVAYILAVTAPARLRSLTLAAPGGLVRAVLRELRVLTLPGMGLLARLPRSRRVTREVLHSCFYDPRKCPPELLEEAYRYGASSAPEMVRTLRSAVTFRRGVREEVRASWIARSSAYAGPALVVWGREDAVVPLPAEREIRQIAPQAEIRILPGCGHLLMVECRDAFLAALLPFLDGGKMEA